MSSIDKPKYTHNPIQEFTKEYTSISMLDNVNLIRSKLGSFYVIVESCKNILLLPSSSSYFQ